MYQYFSEISLMEASLATSLTDLATSLTDYSTAIPASSPLEASRLKLAELQRKSKTLSASLQRHQHVMEGLSNSTAAVEQQAANQEQKRLDSPIFGRYGGGSSSGSSGSTTSTTTATASTNDYNNYNNYNNYNSNLESPSAYLHASSPRRTAPSLSAAFPSRSPRTASADVAVALAKDMAEKRAQVGDLQHSVSMKDVQLQISDTEISRLRSSESTYMTHVSTLTSTVAELKAHIDRQDAAAAQILKRHRAAEGEADSLRADLAAARRSLTGEKVEREALARQVLLLNDQHAALQVDMDMLKERYQAQQKEIQRERSDYQVVVSTMQSDLDAMTQEHHASAKEAADYRARALAFRLRTEESEIALHNVQQVHKASIEQLVDTRSRLKKEQDARWAAETEAARLRGLIE